MPQLVELSSEEEEVEVEVVPGPSSSEEVPRTREEVEREALARLPPDVRVSRYIDLATSSEEEGD